MAWKVDEIRIENFKFFKEEFVLPVDGKNVLLYGENGSGKSSIYWSFYTIYQACLKANQQDAQKYFQYGHSQNLRNRYSTSEQYSGLKITFRNEGTKLSFEDSCDRVCVSDNLHKDFMRLSMASSDFMNYKFLSSIFDFNNSQDNDIFSVLAKEVFPFLNFKDSLILDDGEDSHRHDADFWWKYLSRPYEHVPTRKGDANGSFLVTSDKYKSFTDKLKRFNRNLEQELRLIFHDANTKLSSLFGERISLHFDYFDATFNDKIGNSRAHDGKLHCPKIIVYAKMTDPLVKDKSEIRHPTSFFNEARLTCMALALRLAFLDARIVSGEDFAPVIFIDDLLISLDMGCRKSVISILLNYASSKQMLMFTHDRAFYNIALSEIDRRNEKENWKTFNMYSHSEDLIPMPVLVVDKSKLDQAKRKFYELDFAGCANTLRSACESELKRILPLHLVLKKTTDDKDTITVQGLNSLVNKVTPFRKRMFDNLLNEFPIIVPNLSNHRKLILNPYSHDDSETPFFKSELKQAISEIEELTKIRKVQLITDDEIGTEVFEISIANDANVIASATFKFVERVERVEYASNRYYSASKICVIACQTPRINYNSPKYNIRNLYKDLYEAIGLTAETRPLFDESVKRVRDGRILALIKN